MAYSVVRSAAIAAAVAAAFGVGAIAGASGANHTASKGTVVDEAADRIASSAASPVDRAGLEAAAVEAMLAKLGDRWATYYAAGDYAQLKALLDGRYSGLGVWLRRTDLGAIVVASVLPESPADAAGLRVGDRITLVDGHLVKANDLGDVVTRLRGPSGSIVRLEIERAGVTKKLTLRRSSVGNGDVSVAYVAPGVARIRVAAFTRGVGSQVKHAVETLRKDHARGIVLDLRGNPGGLLEEGVSVAGTFLDGGVVVSYSGRATAQRVVMAPRGGEITTPLAVLVDGGTASAAEVVTGALQDRGRAVVVGAQTFGKGSVQEPIRLSDGSAIELTVARYLTPRGRSLDGVGITPDIVLPGGADEAVAVRRAVDVLQGLVADVGTAGATGRG